MVKAKKDYTKMSLEELSELLVEAQDQLKQAKLSKLNDELANPARIKALRREIARIQTAINALIIRESEEE